MKGWASRCGTSAGACSEQHQFDGALAIFLSGKKEMEIRLYRKIANPWIYVSLLGSNVVGHTRSLQINRAYKVRKNTYWPKWEKMTVFRVTEEIDAPSHLWRNEGSSFDDSWKSRYIPPIKMVGRNIPHGYRTWNFVRAGGGKSGCLLTHNIIMSVIMSMDTTMSDVWMKYLLDAHETQLDPRTGPSHEQINRAY